MIKVKDREKKEKTMTPWGSVAYYDAFGSCGPIDPFTRQPVERTKMSHPYSYSMFVVWERKPAECKEKHPGAGGCYSDRLYQWDWDKYNRCRMEVFGDKAQVTWSRDPPQKIERFLRLYFGEPTLELVLVAEGCNVGNGFPVWYFAWKIGRLAEDKKEG